MSETLSQDPDGLGVAYTNLSQTYPPNPATPSSTVQDGGPPGANLPPFSTFASDMDSNPGFGSVSDRLFSDTRLLDISNWDYYTETRLLERGENGLSIITSQPQYRPWESKPGADPSTSTYPGTTPISTLADAFSQQNGASKLPSFQSQFQTFSDQATTTEPTTLTTLTNLTPVSPNSSSPQSLTTLNSNFHTLSAVNVNRSYPLVPAPIQAREIPSIQQQFLDERHIQLYSHPPANIALNNTLHPTFLNGQNGALIQNNQLISSPTVVTVLKSEPDIKLSSNLAALHQESLKLQNVGLHPTQFQNPMTQLHNSDNGLYNGIEKKMNGNMTSPTRNDFRKKERRKMRASSLESSVDSDGASSNMDLGSENSGQVAAISSTAGFKTHQMQVNSSVDMDTDISGGSIDKQVKKKRKRCGECIGCQRKDNCGDCAPCRNDKSHQICKQRRCEKLTEKKNLYQDGFLRGESRRGRGKGRGGASYRGRKPSAGVSNPLSAGNLPPEGATVVPSGAQPSSRPSPQPTQSVPQPMPVQQQPMTPMPFYADPNRFPTPVWQTDPTQGWPQGQFIQQIPTAGQPIEAYQQYPNGIYQTTYQQPAFETNTFYTGAVQVLTNPRPPSNPNQQVVQQQQQQQQLAPPRPNSSNYSHTPSPSPAQTQQQQNVQTQAQGAANRQYQEYGQQQQNFTATTPTGTETSGNNSRPGSVNNMNPPTPNQNYQQQSAQPQTPQTPQQQQQNFTAITNFSPNSQASYQNSGNGQPGYPQVNSSSPQLASHSSSGYPGQEQFGGQHEQQWHDEQVMWEQQQHQQQQQIKIEQDYNNQSQSNAYMQQEVNNSPTKMDSMHSEVKPFSQADKVNLNTRIKTMILNKQQENKMEESKNVDQNTTGHFLWYSHHHHLKENLGVDGGSFKHKNDTDKQQQNKTENYDLKQACDPVNYSSGCWKSSNNFRHEQIAQNYTKANLQQTTAQHYPVAVQQTRHCQNVPNANYNQPRAPQHDLSSHNSVFRQPQNVRYRKDPKNAQTSQERQSPVLLDYTSPSRHDGQTANQPRFQVNGTQNSTNFKPEQSSYPRESARPTPPASNLIYAPNHDDASVAQSFNPDYQQEIKQEMKYSTSISENHSPCDQTFNRRLTEPAVPLPIKQEFSPDFDANQQTRENVNANTPPASNAKPGPNCSPYNLPPNYPLSAMDLSQYKSSKGNLQGVQRDQQPNKAAVINNSNNNLPHNENQYKSPKIVHTTPIQTKGIPFEEQEQDSPIFGEKPNMEIPNCKCISPPKTSTEEGVYYTHLGCANSLRNLRYDFECRTGVVGNAIRIEKVRYTGKEGKTAQGCPIAKWIIRRQNNDEKYLVIVKHRKGHVCHSAFIVICIVAWEGVESGGADELYSLLTDKLNKFGVPTKRRCATNEPRTCACQGVDPDSCGASFSFGCSWSMFFNGCKFARSKDARKFRLTEKKEEKQLEEKMQKLANQLSPVYKCLAPKSFNNQIVHEEVASDCRLGDLPGRPFSGVTACVDFCAHAHKDTHNMINGCTVVVTLTKHRDLSKAPDEQLHVLPMYVADDTDEFGSREEQEKKVLNGGIEILEKYPREVRTCSVPASTCQKRGRKPKEDKQVKRKLSFLSSSSSSNSFSSSSNDKYASSNEIQNGHVSSTVLDYPNKSTNWKYDNYQPASFNSHGLHPNPSHGNALPQFSVFKTPLSPDCYYRNDYSAKYYNPSYHYFTPNLMSTPHLSSYAAQFSNYPSYQINNPFDDLYTNNTLHSLDFGPPQLPNPPGKFIDISYTDNIECFRDRDIGGVAIALSHGSVLFECAKHEIHATTAIKKPNRLSPTRISLVFYQHKSLNASQHGLNEYVKKMKRKSEENGQDLEKSDGDKIEYSSVLVEKKDVMLRAPTLPTVTVTTLFPMYPCIVTGPFQEQ